MHDLGPKDRGEDHGNGAPPVPGPGLDLDDFVLTPAAADAVNEVIGAITLREEILDTWGLGSRIATGRGVCVLVDGPPGTGKTVLAMLLARKLGLEYLSVDLTDAENVFGAAIEMEGVGGIVLVEQVDRPAGGLGGETGTGAQAGGLEAVQVLASLLDESRGIFLLTAHAYGAIDGALVQRITHRIVLSEPDVTQRARIWRCLLPLEAPLAEDIDLDALARNHELDGRLIARAWLHGATVAAAAGKSLDQAMLNAASRRELRISGRLTREAVPSAVPDSEEQGL